MAEIHLQDHHIELIHVFHLTGDVPDIRGRHHTNLVIRPDLLTVSAHTNGIRTHWRLSGLKVLKSGGLGETRHELDRSDVVGFDDLNPDWLVPILERVEAELAEINIPVAPKPTPIERAAGKLASIGGSE